MRWNLKEACYFEGFNQMHLLYKGSSFIGINKLVQGIKNTGDFFVIFTDMTDIKENLLDVTINDVAKLLRFICGLNNGIILVLDICKSQMGC